MVEMSSYKHFISTISAQAFLVSILGSQSEVKGAHCKHRTPGKVEHMDAQCE